MTSTPPPMYNRKPRKKKPPIGALPEVPIATPESMAQAETRTLRGLDASLTLPRTSDGQVAVPPDGITTNKADTAVYLVTSESLEQGAFTEVDDDFGGLISKAGTLDVNGLEVLEIKLPEGLSAAKFSAVLHAAHLTWLNGNGEPPDTTSVANLAGIPVDYVKDIMTTAAFKVAAKSRGILAGAMPGLSPRQITALQIIMDPTAGKGLAQRLRRAGVPLVTYKSWMRQSAFRAEANKLASVLSDHESDMATTLAALAVDGDLNAIKFAWEVTGKYNPQDRNSMQVREVLALTLEILQTEITDSDTLARVGMRIQALAISSGAFAAGNTPEAPQIEGA